MNKSMILTISALKDSLLVYKKNIKNVGYFVVIYRNFLKKLVLYNLNRLLLMQKEN